MDSRGALRVRGAHQFGKRIVADISEIYTYIRIYLRILLRIRVDEVAR